MPEADAHREPEFHHRCPSCSTSIANYCPETESNPNRENESTGLRRSGIFPRWTNVTDGYNDFYAVAVVPASCWGSLDEAYREPPVLWGEFGGRDCIPSRGFEVLTCTPTLRRRGYRQDSLPSHGDGNSTANIAAENAVRFIDLPFPPALVFPYLVPTPYRPPHGHGRNSGELCAKDEGICGPKTIFRLWPKDSPIRLLFEEYNRTEQRPGLSRQLVLR